MAAAHRSAVIGAEPTYCFCNNVSYGDMIACDNENCPFEWFHFPCVGVTEKPQKGQTWYCLRCAPYFKNKQKPAVVKPAAEKQSEEYKIIKLKRARR